MPTDEQTNIAHNTLFPSWASTMHPDQPWLILVDDLNILMVEGLMDPEQPGNSSEMGAAASEMGLMGKF